MSNIKAIRARLGLTQSALARGIGCTQGNVGHYENKGQTIPPDTAKRLIAFAAAQGHVVSYEDIYGDPGLTQAPATIAQPAIDTVAAEAATQFQIGEIRTGTVRRHNSRRAKDIPVDLDRRKEGPPYQSIETGRA
jgi:putative transcriptional regulator